MSLRSLVGSVLVTTTILVVATASAARAADQQLELGASLVNATIGLGSNDVSTFSMPAGGLGTFTPGVYASFFVGERAAIEPQIGFFSVKSGGHSNHFLNLVGQFDYFIEGISRQSFYVFGAAGITDVSGVPTTPKSVAFGVGDRIPAGGRLTFRFDGRVTHFTDGGGNSIGFTVSIGGLIGRS
jgi:hypothetical protein